TFSFMVPSQFSDSVHYISVPVKTLVPMTGVVKLSCAYPIPVGPRNMHNAVHRCKSYGGGLPEASRFQPAAAQGLRAHVLATNRIIVMTVIALPFLTLIADA
ncbi:hypothetical protein, partial [Streptosporangium nondiastaticum]|uniref:hypothetical protein n=1 Tax=Streptosporangium nondiastaticum TaxID=35764 RepID=UPI001CB988BA